MRNGPKELPPCPPPTPVIPDDNNTNVPFLPKSETTNRRISWAQWLTSDRIKKSTNVSINENQSIDDYRSISYVKLSAYHQKLEQELLRYLQESMSRMREELLSTLPSRVSGSHTENIDPQALNVELSQLPSRVKQLQDITASTQLQLQEAVASALGSCATPEGQRPSVVSTQVRAMLENVVRSVVKEETGRILNQRVVETIQTQLPRMVDRSLKEMGMDIYSIPEQVNLLEDLIGKCHEQAKAGVIAAINESAQNPKWKKLVDDIVLNLQKDKNNDLNTRSTHFDEDQDAAMERAKDINLMLFETDADFRQKLYNLIDFTEVQQATQQKVRRELCSPEMIISVILYVSVTIGGALIIFFVVLNLIWDRLEPVIQTKKKESTSLQWPYVFVRFPCQAPQAKIKLLNCVKFMDNKTYDCSSQTSLGHYLGYPYLIVLSDSQVVAQNFAFGNLFHMALTLENYDCGKPSFPWTKQSTCQTIFGSGICNLECATGYVGRVSAKCQINGKWIYEGGCVPEASNSLKASTSCPAVNVPFMDFQSSKCDDRSYNYSERCSFRCNSGYVPSQSTLTCTITDGAYSWSPLPICNSVCDSSITLNMNNMSSTCNNQVIEGSSCLLSCYPGFKANDDSPICVGRNNWTVSPQCLRPPSLYPDTCESQGFELFLSDSAGSIVNFAGYSVLNMAHILMEHHARIGIIRQEYTYMNTSTTVTFPHSYGLYSSVNSESVSRVTLVYDNFDVLRLTEVYRRDWLDSAGIIGGWFTLILVVRSILQSLIKRMVVYRMKKKIKSNRVLNPIKSKHKSLSSELLERRGSI
eukprot:NODE_412_length_2798_cov_40.416449_g353_i0.p1 GENE.NODE_412_length_2798_cov_40.416449_g353_i0~~NODE_412_length_2798_cov_40.416449_g353_i0.p1  ORF type:complete len:812 (-),score=130.43 NODE_412_length_2798_cov_40.416449_g353_i0:188-2623(-)